VLSTIAQTIDRYRMFEGARRVGVATSGGADSVCLLHALGELAGRYGIALSVVHLDHGLRGAESRSDAEFVRDLAGRLCLPFHLRTLDLRGAGGNLEQEARRARLAFFGELIETGVLDRVATGHTRSDQAETVLFRFLRGSGGAGLSGIRPVTAEGVVRPLIAIDRTQVIGYLNARGIAWREDSSNRSPDFARNRIRHELLPQLAREWNPAIVETLAHMADWATEEEACQAAGTDRLAAEHFHQSPGAVTIRVDVLASLPRAAARRLVRRAIEQVKGDLRAVGFPHVEAVLDLAEDPEGGYADLPGVAVCRSFDWVRFSLPQPACEWRVNVPIPGHVQVPGTALSISLEIVDNSETSRPSDYVYNIEMGCLDWKRLPGFATLRNWRPGDRYQPMGSPGESKLKDLFQRARIPVWERTGWPILETGEQIVWSRRFGAAVWCAAGPETPVILRVREAAR
jgi:tRNA(Ile)-lysidine synthase